MVHPPDLCFPPLMHAVGLPPIMQLAKLKQEAESKALVAAAARAVVNAAQQAQREGRLLTSQEIAEIR